MKNKQSEWFKGLKYAESVGAKEAYNMACVNEFDDNDFLKGILDYIEYYKARIQK